MEDHVRRCGRTPIAAKSNRRHAGAAALQRVFPFRAPGEGVLCRVDKPKDALDEYRAAVEASEGPRRNLPLTVPCCFFDLAEIRLYQGRVDDAVAMLHEGSDPYGKDQLSDFRALLDRLRKTKADVPG